MVGPVTRRVLLATLLVVGCASCKTGKRTEHRHVVDEERVVMDWGKRVTIHGTALVPSTGGSMVALWSDDDGVWSIPVPAKGKVEGEPRPVSLTPAGYMAAASLGTSCTGSAARHVVVVAPRIDVTVGSAPLEVVFLDVDGDVLARSAIDGAVGPYTSSITVDASCNAVLVGWHQGAIGDFSSRVALLNAHDGTVRWERRLSETGKNGFCPGVLATDDMYVAVWGEARVSFPSSEHEEPEPDRLLLEVLDGGGKPASGPVEIARSFRAEVRADILLDDERLLVLYKDHPLDEYREGVYLTITDLEGTSRLEPVRIGRGDGPDPPALMSVYDDRYASITVRSLASELLIGVNFLDEQGAKQGRELQIYAHRVRFRHLHAIRSGEDIVMLHAEHGERATRLLLTILRDRPTRH